jgi:hypothetical protein
MVAMIVVALGGHRSTIAGDRQQGWQPLPRTSVALRSSTDLAHREIMWPSQQPQ